VRLAASCSQEAVTFHEQCGSGWLGPGRIYFLPFSPQIFPDSYGSKWKAIEIRFIFAYTSSQQLCGQEK
jgi:hypothetical protein